MKLQYKVYHHEISNECNNYRIHWFIRVI